MSEKTISGQCMCGAVTVTAVQKAAELHACHCDMCRRWTGSAFVEVDAVPGTVVANGPVKTVASSDWAERAWCDQCGSTLWYRTTLSDHAFHALSAGLFDNAADLSLTKEIYIDRKPAGYEFAGTHLKMTKAEVEKAFASMSEGDA